MISSSVRAERGEEKKKRESRPCVSVYASEAPHMSPVNRRSLSLGRRTAPSRLTVPHARRPGAHGGSKGHITREYKQNLTTEEPPSPLTPPLLLPDVVTMPPFPFFFLSFPFFLSDSSPPLLSLYPSQLTMSTTPTYCPSDPRFLSPNPGYYI